MTAKQKLEAPPARKWVPLDIQNASLKNNDLLECLLESIEMKPVWDLLWNHRNKFEHVGPAASLVFTLSGLLRGPHRSQLLSESERHAKADRIKRLCEELEGEINDLQDPDFGLPRGIAEELRAAAEPAFTKWRQESFQSCQTDVLRYLAGLAKDRGSQSADIRHLLEQECLPATCKDGGAPDEEQFDLSDHGACPPQHTDSAWNGWSVLPIPRRSGA